MAARVGAAGAFRACLLLTAAVAQAFASRHLEAGIPTDAGARARFLSSPVLAKYHKLMASQRSFHINVVGNNSHYMDNVHTFTLELLRYCEPESLAWDHSDELGVSWSLLNRSFTSSSSRPCRLNYVVDLRARASLEQWLGRVFSMSAVHTSNQSHLLEDAEVPGLRQCKLRRKVDVPITVALREADNATAFEGLEPEILSGCMGTQLEVALLPYELFGKHEPYLAWMAGVHHDVKKIGIYNMRTVWLTRNWVADIMPLDAEYLITIDVDTLLLDDLDKLFELYNDFQPETVIGLALEQYGGYAKPEIFGKFIEACPSCRMGRIGGFPGMAGGVALLHLNQMRTSNAFKSFYSNASNARIAVDRMFTHPDQGFAYPDQDIHTALALLHPEIFYVIPCMWNWQLSHNVWWEYLPKDDIKIGQHIRTCLHPPKIMHGKLGQKFPKGFYSHRRKDSGKYARIGYDLPDVTGGEAIESAHGGTLPGHIIDMCLTQCSAISAGLL